MNLLGSAAPQTTRLLGRRPVQDEAELFRIWSNKHGAWWMEGELGYTAVLERAGRYPLLTAERIVKKSYLGGLIVREGITVPGTHLIPVPVRGYGS